MTTNASTPAPSVPLFCGVCAQPSEQGATPVFRALTEETGTRIPLTSDPNGPVILACNEEHARPAALSVRKLYSFAWTEATWLEAIINPPAPVADDEEGEESQATRDEPDDSEEPDEEPEDLAPAQEARQRVKAAPPAPASAAGSSDDDDWDSILDDLQPSRRPTASATATKAKPKPKTAARAAAGTKRAPIINVEDTPNLSNDEVRTARAWAIETGLLTSEGKEVAPKARLHRSIKAAWAEAGRPTEW